MTIFPVRNLAERGVVADPAPWDLPPNALSSGSNIRFRDGRIGRSPIFRTVDGGLAKTPQTVVGYRPSTGYDLVFYGGTDGSITDTLGADRTPTGRALASDDRAWTDAFLGDVLYLNRPDFVPAAYLPGAAKFVDLANWPSDWRCRSLRACRDQLFAFNITRTGSSLPTTILWSDYTLAGLVPGSWDPTILSGAANEVLLPRLESPLVDGVKLGDNMVAYSENQITLVEFTGDVSNAGQNLWINRELFNRSGMINSNCGVEVRGRHFVFGQDDLYIHDGVQQQSLVDGKLRRWVFDNMNVRLANRNFVTYLPRTDEVLFAFASGDSDRVFGDPTFCNRGVLINAATLTGAPVDLPDVSAFTQASVDPTLLWSDAVLPRTWSTTGGSWFDLRDGTERHAVLSAAMSTTGLSAPAIMAYDEMDRGRLALPADTSLAPVAFVERIGIDLDEAGVGLSVVKTILAMYPQFRVYRDVPTRIRVGSAMAPQGPYTWGPWVPFDPTTQHKVDVRRSGRFLAYRLEVLEPADFDLSGFDADVKSGGGR